MKPAPFASAAPESTAPIYIHDWPELRDQCRNALARRRAAYPAWIEKRQITADLAARDIAAWETLLAQWLYVVDGPDAPAVDGVAPARPDLLSLVARTEAVALALSRIDQEIGRGNRSHDVLLQSHLNQALRWHLEREQRGCETAVMVAELNRSIAADRAARGLPASAVRFLMSESEGTCGW